MGEFLKVVGGFLKSKARNWWRRGKGVEKRGLITGWEGGDEVILLISKLICSLIDTLQHFSSPTFNLENEA